MCKTQEQVNLLSAVHSSRIWGELTSADKRVGYPTALSVQADSVLGSEPLSWGQETAGEEGYSSRDWPCAPNKLPIEGMA